MATTTKVERDKALEWIARQLRWEQALTNLRDGKPAVERKAA
jgi:hypothetical protein